MPVMVPGDISISSLRDIFAQDIEEARGISMDHLEALKIYGRYPDMEDEIEIATTRGLTFFFQVSKQPMQLHLRVSPVGRSVTRSPPKKRVRRAQTVQPGQPGLEGSDDHNHSRSSGSGGSEESVTHDGNATPAETNALSPEEVFECKLRMKFGESMKSQKYHGGSATVECLPCGAHVAATKLKLSNVTRHAKTCRKFQMVSTGEQDLASMLHSNSGSILNFLETILQNDTETYQPVMKIGGKNVSIEEWEQRRKPRG